MTSEDGLRRDPLDGLGPGGPLDDGPVIDPRDPLGLGDLPLDDVVAAPGDDDPPLEDDVPPPDDDELLLPDDDLPDDGSDTPPPELPDPPGPAEGASVAVPVDDGRVGDPDDEAAPVAADAAHVPAGRDEVPDDAPEHAPAGAPDDAPGEEPAAGAPVRPARSGWARLGHAMRPRTTQGQLIAAGLCALLGFALVVQVRQTTDTQLGALRQNDLVRLLDETTTRTDELEQESLDLQRERDELLSGSDRQQAALDAARRTAAMQGILTGRLPATGPGVRITLTEPDGEIRPATMLHMLEELRNAGAEAMELNGLRIIASSAFTGTRGAVVLDGTALEPPYRWNVIGDPDTIAPALEIPGGALARVRVDNGRATVEKSDRVEVTAVRELPDPVHATPVEDDD